MADLGYRADDGSTFLGSRVSAAASAVRSEYSLKSMVSSRRWSWHTFVHGYPADLGAALAAHLQRILYSPNVSTFFKPGEPGQFLLGGPEGAMKFLDTVELHQSTELRDIILVHLKETPLLKRWVRRNRQTFSTERAGASPLNPVQPNFTRATASRQALHERDGRLRNWRADVASHPASASSNNFSTTRRPTPYLTDRFRNGPRAVLARHETADELHQEPNSSDLLRPLASQLHAKPSDPEPVLSKESEEGDLPFNFCIRCGFDLAGALARKARFSRSSGTAPALGSHGVRHQPPSIPSRPKAPSPIPPRPSLRRADTPPSGASDRHAHFAASSENSIIPTKEPSQASSMFSHSLQPRPAPGSDPPQSSIMDPGIPYFFDHATLDPVADDLLVPTGLSERDQYDVELPAPSWPYTLPEGTTTLTTEDLRRVTDPLVGESTFVALLTKDINHVLSVRIWKDPQDDLSRHIMQLLADRVFQGANIVVEAPPESDPVSEDAIRLLSNGEAGADTRYAQNEPSNLWGASKRISVHMKPGVKSHMTRTAEQAFGLERSSLKRDFRSFFRGKGLRSDAFIGRPAQGRGLFSGPSGAGQNPRWTF